MKMAVGAESLDEPDPCGGRVPMDNLVEWRAGAPAVVRKSRSASPEWARAEVPKTAFCGHSGSPTMSEIRRVGCTCEFPPPIRPASPWDSVAEEV